MGRIKELGDFAFRDYRQDGIVASGANQPDKQEVRSVTDEIDDRVEGLSATVENLEVSGDTVTKATWAQLMAAPGVRNGQRGYVEVDTGTHTDPVVGGTVPNAGIYTWSVSPAGWRWLRKDDVTIANLAGIVNFGLQKGVATLRGTAWTVSWVALWVQYNGAALGVVDVTDTELTSGELLYIDVDSGTAPYAVIKAATSAAIRADIAAGKKIALIYNALGTLVGPIASTLEIADASKKRNTLSESIAVAVPGHALRKLRLALENPLEQLTGVVFMGDSITWGATLPDNAPSQPRDGTLADPRDNFATGSWVNILKRYIGSVYFPNAAPELSNFSASPSGESVVTFKKPMLLYPGQAPFSVFKSGANVSADGIQSFGLTKLGYRFALSNANSDDTSTIGLQFRFTGDRFKIWYTSVASSSTDYTLLINGVSQGDFSTNSGANVNQLNREHNFPYVRDALIEIRLKRTAGTGNKYLHLEAIEVEKTVIVSNQGINGSSTRTQVNFILSGNFTALPFADYDRFVFVQIGTNDRAFKLQSYQMPDGPLSLKAGLVTEVNRIYELIPDAEIVLMVANRTADFNPSVFSYDMDQVKSMIRDVADEFALDFIDNYSIFNGVDLGVELADGLHPNALGHARIASNIISRLEAS